MMRWKTMMSKEVNRYKYIYYVWMRSSAGREQDDWIETELAD